MILLIIPQPANLYISTLFLYTRFMFFICLYAKHRLICATCRHFLYLININSERSSVKAK